MTPRQKTILDYIREHIAAHAGDAPSQADIAGRLGVSRVTVWEQLRGMAKLNYVRRDAHAKYVPVESRALVFVRRMMRRWPTIIELTELERLILEGK